MKLTLRQLEVFALVARLENVSRAATQLCMSQSAVSSALGELERNFSAQLFDRLGKSLRLNSTGRGILPQVNELLTRAQALESHLAGGGLGPLALGATMTIGNYLGTLVLAEYLRRHPASQVDFHVANTQQVVDKLLGFELDLGLIEGEANDPELVFAPWLEDELVVFCAPTHPLAQVGLARSTVLGEQKWILRERGSGTRALFDRAMRAQQIDFSVCLQLAHTEAIKRAVESGLGIGCLSRLSLRDAFRRGSLVEIKTPELDLSRRFQFAWHRQRQVSSAQQAFVALCREMSGTARTTEELILPFVP